LFGTCVQCVLAAIVIVNLKGVFLQALDLRALHRRSQYFDLVSAVIWSLILVSLNSCQIKSFIFNTIF